MKSHTHHIKRHLTIILGLLLFFPAILISCGIAGGNRNTSDRGNSSKEKTGNNLSSETGITHTQEVPFSKETIDEIKERESKKPPAVPEQRVIPFQEMPPPKELPANEEIKPPSNGEKR